MRVECFFDTNVLVYAASPSPADRAKRTRALNLIRESDFGLAAQVLQEFYVTATRKFLKPLAPEAAIALREAYRVFPKVPTDHPLVVSTVEVSLTHGISYWDAAIIAAAQVLDADTLYSEDLNHGQLYETVRVVNPFLDS